MYPFLTMILVRLGFFLIAAAVVVGILILVGSFDGQDEGSGPAGILEVASQGCQTSICCPDCGSFRVQRIIDGDTLVAGAGGRIRLFGVDAPEVGERCSTEATNRLRELAGTSVRAEPGPRARDSFNRSLFYLYTEVGDSIDEKLIREGLAEAWTRDGQHRDGMVQMEQQARRDQVGCLW